MLASAIASPLRRISSRALPRLKRQGGGVLVMAALWMSVAMSCLLVLDIGNLFWQQRELQKIADMAALAGATGSVETCAINARSSAWQNGLQTDGELSPAPISGRWVPGSFDPSVTLNKANACQVSVQRTVPYFFVWTASVGGSRQLTAMAIAVQKPQLAKLSIRSTLLSVSTNRDASLLNALIGGLLGGSLNVDILGWKGIAALDVNLLSFIKELNIDLSAQVGDYDKLLGAEASIGRIVEALIAVVRRDNPTATVAIKALEAIYVRAKVSPLRVNVFELLSLQTGSPADALNLSANVLDLVQAFIQVGNGNNALATEINIPLIDIGAIYQGVKVGVKVIEKPQWIIGDPAVQEISTKTAQIQLTANVNILAIDVDLNLKVGGASAKLVDYSCAYADKSMSVDVTSAVLKLVLSLEFWLITKNVIGPIEVDLIQDKTKTPIVIGAPGRLPPRLNEPLVENKTETDWRKFTVNSSIVESLGTSIKNLLNSLMNSDGGIVGSLVKFLGWLLAPLGDVLDRVIAKIISPILDPILNELLKVLGIDLAKAEIAGQLNCGGAPELVY